MRFSKGNLSKEQKWILILFFFIPVAVMIARWISSNDSSLLVNHVSSADFSAEMQNRFRYLLFLPLGANIVVLIRLTLGLRIMGPFRSILIAVAFQITGILHGLVFLTIVIGIIVAIRPFLRAIRLPYFGRVSVTLSVVASVMIMLFFFSAMLELESLQRVAYLPVVMMTLMGDRFARILSKEGLYSAMWRGIITTFAAVLITAISEIIMLQKLFVLYPELVIVQVATIVCISKFLDLRLFEGLNPSPIKKSPSGNSRKRKEIKKD